MAYRIVFKPAAQRQLRKVPRQVLTRLVDQMEKLAKEPYPPGAKRLRAEIAIFRVRVGDYRIVYTVVEDRCVVLIVRVGDRRDIYEHWTTLSPSRSHRQRLVLHRSGGAIPDREVTQAELRL